MLRQVLQTVEAAEGPITLSELSRRLNIAPGALAGMLEHWAQRGRLTVDGGSACACADGGGCGSCSGAAVCPFMARLPRSFVAVQTIERRDAMD
ncbi:conserved protein of unknown function [Candidatus Promineifilum breve]|uniref:Transcriptional regulator HTH-type FeoC domain-containing protein n=1 Tax=Candidatus Promineifilum breve TaxID=1806508 RepID=A0A160T5Q8_9CHLR|nr:FeoC-like transcriptional regulator [Candidatus Promineifilum breve]CUS05172.2 conserved protein of unknown function [Candidatus Promineifilum breve]